MSQEFNQELTEEQLESPAAGVDLSPVSNLADQMRQRVAAVMLFFVNQVE
jgi:hypothetical protein